MNYLLRHDLKAAASQGPLFLFYSKSGSIILWFEFEMKATTDKGLFQYTVDVLVYANGSALKEHVVNGERVRWPMKIEGVSPQALDANFFQTFL